MSLACRAGIVLAVILAALLGPTPSVAEPGGSNPPEAQRLFELGVEMGRQERWAEAERYFTRSMALIPRASTSYNRIVSLFRMGRFIELLREAERYFALAGPSSASGGRDSVKALVRRAEAMLATLVLDVIPYDAHIAVDGEALRGETRRVQIDPGEHAVVATAPGFAREALRVNLLAGEIRTVELRLRSIPATPEAPTGAPSSTPPAEEAPVDRAEQRERSLVPYVLLGSGGALVIAGVVTGAIVYSRNEDLGERCPDGLCPDQRALDEQTRVERLALVTDILYGAGIATAGAGVLWLLLADEDEESQTRASPTWHPDVRIGNAALHVSLGGAF